MFKYICSRCSVGLSKKDKKLSEQWPFGKLLCFDCLIKVGDLKLPKIKVSKLFRLLGGTDTEFEKELKKSEKQLSTVNKIRSKYDFH